jgi:polyphenol oxidase
MVNMIPLFKPDWSAPPGVQAIGTMRGGGVSSGVYDSMNLGAHVGDEPAKVLENRRLLLSQLQGVSKLCFVNQVHGTRAVLAEDGERVSAVLESDSRGFSEERLMPSMLAEADALVTRKKGLGLVIQTADCLPVFFASSDGKVIGVAHAGWRGLAAGILENTVTLMRQEAQRQGTSEKIMASFGASIGPEKFEVGPEVKAAFLNKKTHLAELFFKSGAQQGKYLANLYGLASLRLGLVDVDVIGRCTHCTVSEPESFFSFRRDGQTGRQASVIWIS